MWEQVTVVTASHDSPCHWGTWSRHKAQKLAQTAESKLAGAGVQMGASVESYRLLIVRPDEIFAPAPSYMTSAAENEMMIVRKKE